VNDRFIPIELNITDQGFPENVPGLNPWHRAFDKLKFAKSAFATSTVLTPDGSSAIGTSGSGFAWEWRTAANYHPDRYLVFLNQSLDRYSRICEVKANPNLNAVQKQLKIAGISLEIAQQAKNANPSTWLHH
jgi:hypothetical protein